MPSYSALTLSEHVGGQLSGDETTIITGLSSLLKAGVSDLACVFHEKHRLHVQKSKANCFLLRPEDASSFHGITAIIVPSPVEAFALLAPLFENERCLQRGVDKRAQLGRDVSIDESAYVGPNCIIGDRVRIGKNTQICANVVIANDVEIGHHTRIDTGVILGGNPFNPLKSKGVWSDGQAFGTVIVSDDVSIGANTVVDCGVHSDTFIEEGVKIDNLVQVAHDVIIGKSSIVVACSAIGANTVIGEHCVIGGGASIAGNLEIVDNVSITGTAVVTRSVRKEGIYSSGTTIESHKKWRKNVARFHRLDLMALKVRRLERNLQDVLERVEL